MREVGRKCERKRQNVREGATEKVRERESK